MPSLQEVLERLKRSIAATVATDSVNEFYVGRSVDMEGRNGDHGSHEIRCLYETRSVDRALDLEDALTKHFYNHAKNNNEQSHSGGSTAEGLQHIYLALWFA